MLPTNSRMPIGGPSSVDSQFPEYLRRLTDLRQMDFESAFDQMFSLLSTDTEAAYDAYLFSVVLIVF